LNESQLPRSEELLEAAAANAKLLEEARAGLTRDLWGARGEVESLRREVTAVRLEARRFERTCNILGADYRELATELEEVQDGKALDQAQICNLQLKVRPPPPMRSLPYRCPNLPPSSDMGGGGNVVLF
jgi:hypothetical protein